MRVPQDRWTGLQRVGCGLFGLIAIGMSLPSMIQGQWNVDVRFHSGFVFAPLICLLGAVALLAAIFSWERLWLGPESKKHKRKHAS